MQKEIYPRKAKLVMTGGESDRFFRVFRLSYNLLGFIRGVGR
jgi:hypothetical protein